MYIYIPSGVIEIFFIVPISLANFPKFGEIKKF